MTEHWHPRFGARQMLVASWGSLGACLVGWVDAGPRSKLPRSGDLVDGGGSASGLRVRAGESGGRPGYRPQQRQQWV